MRGCNLVAIGVLVLAVPLSLRPPSKMPDERRTGVNAGLGLEMPRERVTAFVDLRYHIVYWESHASPLRMMPLSLGLGVH
jgi:hypothetical protein